MISRRTFLMTSSAALASPLAAAPKGGIIELRSYSLRNNADGQVKRSSDFIEKHVLPASRRAGVGTQGVFANLIGPGGPSILIVNSYASLAAMELSAEKLAADKDYGKALADYYAQPGLGYMRVNSSLLRAIDSLPAIAAPPIEADKPARIFELRTYESNNNATLAQKVKMFESGELDIFRRVGMKVVFFGTTLAGPNMPNLTYMLGYDSLAHRDETWKAFLADPQWVKMRATPGWSDAEIVSNISNVMLRPLPFSPIR